jgi:uncharacterized ferritin-like protein (DUF455 family)
MLAENDPVSVLKTGPARDKAAQARLFRRHMLSGDISLATTAPDNPARPEKPDLVAPRELKRRRLGSAEGRAALLHAIAHIELNAIDLAADMIARFSEDEALIGHQREFILDWSSVCDDEARHFVMIADRMDALGFQYGDFPAHNGLWDAALKTKTDIAARLAVAPLVLEARGLDVTPGMIEKLKQAGDMKSASVLDVIYDEEVGHVAIGIKWLKHVADHRKIDPKMLFRGMVLEYYQGSIRPPLNHEARQKAGFELDFYDDLAHPSKT